VAYTWRHKTPITMDGRITGANIRLLNHMERFMLFAIPANTNPTKLKTKVNAMGNRTITAKLLMPEAQIEHICYLILSYDGYHPVIFLHKNLQSFRTLQVLFYYLKCLILLSASLSASSGVAIPSETLAIAS